MAGVNLSGPEFGADQDSYYAYAKPYVVDYYLGKGMSVFRIPFKWARLQPVIRGDFDRYNIGEIDRLVKQITRAGVYVILDMHNFMRREQDSEGADVIGVSGATGADYADVWRRLASRYLGNDRVIFNLMNEPHDIDSDINVSIQNAAIRAIRDAGARNLILASPNYWGSAPTWDWSDNPVKMLDISDPINNTAFDIHYYFTGVGDGKQCTVGAGSTDLVTVTNWLRTNGKKAFLGEFATHYNPGCYKEMDNLLGFIDANRDVWLGWSYWPGGGLYPADDEFSLDPLDFDNPIDRPQMLVISPHIR